MAIAVVLTAATGRPPEYNIWGGIKRRTRNPKYFQYHLYGGRGIKMCDRWFDSFENFLEDMGPRPSKKHSLDRIKQNGNYEKSNCRWATAIEQNNNSRKNVWIDRMGLRMTPAQWARKLDISVAPIYRRLYRNQEPLPELLPSFA